MRGNWWAMTERVTSEELRAEGAALKHCAAGYVARCKLGVSAVFGLTLNGSPRLTIEIAPHTGEVVQVRGLHNRPPPPEESAVVAKWRRRRRVIRRHG